MLDLFSLARLNTGSIDSARKVFFPAAIELNPLNVGRHPRWTTSTRLPVKRFRLPKRISRPDVFAERRAFADWKESRICKLIH